MTMAHTLWLSIPSLGIVWLLIKVVSADDEESREIWSSDVCEECPRMALKGEKLCEHHLKVRRAKELKAKEGESS